MLAPGLDSSASHPKVDGLLHRLAWGWELQLLVGPMGRQGGQQTGSVAVDAEHGVGSQGSHQPDQSHPRRQGSRRQGQATKGTASTGWAATVCIPQQKFQPAPKSLKIVLAAASLLRRPCCGVLAVHFESSADVDPKRQRLERFIERVQSQPEIEFAVKRISTMTELLALSRRIGTPVEEMDLVLGYRDLDEPFWPWAGMSKQTRRFFVHERKMPTSDPDDLGPEPIP